MNTKVIDWVNISFLILFSISLTRCTFVYDVKLNGTVLTKGCFELSVSYPILDRIEERAFPISEDGRFNGQIKFIDMIPKELFFLCAQDTVGRATVTSASKNHVVMLIRGISGGKEWVRNEDWVLTKAPPILDSLMF